MLLSSWLDKTVELPINDELYLKELNKRVAISREKRVEDILIDNSNSFGGTK